MPKIKELIQPPPEPEGDGEQQLAALRDYLVKITQELYYLLTHLEADNINDSTFQKISEMIPRPYVGQPLPDGDASSGQSSQWARGDHRHGHDSSKADVTALEAAKEELVDALELEADAREAHEEDTDNPHSVTKAQVGLGNVANERQYSAQYPPPIPTPGEVGAVPVTREINGHALSADVTLDHTDVGAIPAAAKGSAGGVAELDSNGMVPSAQLPSYVDDVLEYASLSAFPATGESGKIYVALDTNKTYRWSGSAYVEISESLALGETSSTAYRGDRGKAAYDHSQLTSGNPHNVTAAEVGLGNVANERQYSALNPPPLPTPADIGAATAQDLTDHVGDTTNPHGVTAAQAGARPDTWMPTAADVGARADTWMPTAADVGARPDTWTPSKSDIGLGSVENERQYSALNPPPYPVTSVNGNTGAVVLDASDVGARADNWVPSASDVGVIPNPAGSPTNTLTKLEIDSTIYELTGGGGGGPDPATQTPVMDGTGAVGSSLKYAREDHEHPADTGKQDTITASGILKGDGAGGVSAAAAGTDYQTPLTAGADYATPGMIPTTPADIGALPADGTAVNAGTLAVSHTISGNAGWYQFFEDTVSEGTSRNYVFLITNTYNRQSGILLVYVNQPSGSVTVDARILSGEIPADSVRWEYTTSLNLYIRKDSGSAGYIQFRVMSNAARTGNPINLTARWKASAVSEPTTAVSAVADVLRFTAQAISAGSNQQILSISNAAITADHVLARIEFADPAYITTGYSWITADGSFTLTGTATAATTANILLVRKGN